MVMSQKCLSYCLIVGFSLSLNEKYIFLVGSSHFGRWHATVVVILFLFQEVSLYFYSVVLYWGVAFIFDACWDFPQCVLAIIPWNGLCSCGRLYVLPGQWGQGKALAYGSTRAAISPSPLGYLGGPGSPPSHRVCGYIWGTLHSTDSGGRGQNLLAGFTGVSGALYTQKATE